MDQIKKARYDDDEIYLSVIFSDQFEGISHCENGVKCLDWVTAQLCLDLHDLRMAVL